MQVFNKHTFTGILLAALLSLTISSCRKETTADVKINNVTYHLDTLNLYSSAAQKTRQKTPAQYVSILYTNLYQKSIPSNTLNDLDVLTSSIGDKQLCNELIVKSFITGTGVFVPMDAVMRADIDKFITNTYILFYLRKPTELERYHFKALIQKDTNLTPTDIYMSFALSTEYLFY
jgi:hypothetical protein